MTSAKFDEVFKKALTKNRHNFERERRNVLNQYVEKGAEVCAKA